MFESVRHLRKLTRNVEANQSFELNVRPLARQIEIESAVDAVVAHAASALDRRAFDALKRAANASRDTRA